MASEGQAADHEGQNLFKASYKNLCFLVSLAFCATLSVSCLVICVICCILCLRPVCRTRWLCLKKDVQCGKRGQL